MVQEIRPTNLGIAVVGSGPAALSAVRTWRELDPHTQIDVIDIGREAGPADAQNLVGVALKSYRGSAYPYDLNEFLPLDHVDMRPTVWPSAGFGGFSRVWGAALGQDPPLSSLFNPIETLNPMDPRSQLFTRSGLKMAETIQRKTREHSLGELQPRIHHLAVDSSKCIKCGDCLTGCPTDAIWFAGQGWNSLENIKFVLGGPVTKIVESQDFVNLFIGTNPEPRPYSRVLIGCGPIGTAALLMRSGLLPNEVEIQDSATVFIPLLRLPTFENQNSFALSQFAFDVSRPPLHQIHIQYYPDSRKMVDRAMNFLPFGKLILKFLWRCISPFTCAAIAYLDSSDSDAIVLTMRSDGEFSLKPRRKPGSEENRALALKVIAQNLRKVGLVCLSKLSKFGAPGEGYHFGAVEGLDYLGGKSLVPGTSRVHVIDGSGLATIGAGPITDSIVLRAEEIVREILND